MLQDSRPHDLELPLPSQDHWAEFRVTQPQERLRLLRDLRDSNTPVILSSADGTVISTSLWAVDSTQARLNFNVDPAAPQVERLVDADEVGAVAYLESVKLQFELQGFVLVRGQKSCALQSGMPREIYRFQRRGAYRVRTASRRDPAARFLHPALPEMALSLRILDVSIGGCSLWLPQDVPPLQAGTRIGEMQVELDADNRFSAPALLQHVTSLTVGEGGERGVRVGCEWKPLAAGSERVLQRWIDRAQQRRRVLALD